MGRNNSSKRRPQRIKHRIEDGVARRALARAVEDSYRDEGSYTLHPGGEVVRTFTDPSFHNPDARFEAILSLAMEA